jgi:hypothetical protein
VKNKKKYIRMMKQSRISTMKQTIRFKFGVQVPRNYKEALKIDAENGDTQWTQAIQAELQQINEYDTFQDLGKQAPPPSTHKRINVHFVFDVKFDLRCKARLVAGGHLTDPLIQDAPYSGIASLKSIRTCLFIAELNGLSMCAADVGNAYLEAKTKEKVYIVAGPEFGELQGHTLVIDKALYGLRTSGARWAERLADTLRDQGFFPSHADPAIWMRDVQDHYEYICVWVDDMLILS